MAEREIHRLQEGRTETRHLLDLTHGGLAIQTMATDAFAKGEENSLTESARKYLTTAASNHFNSPYVWSWELLGKESKIFNDDGPFSLSSIHSPQHVTLLLATRDDYEGLQSAQLRLLLGGEDAIVIDEPYSKISKDEFTHLLTRAASNGLIKDNPEYFPDIEIPDDGFGLWFNFGAKLLTEELGTNLTDTWERMKLSERFRERTLKAAVHKLGAHLGLVDQLTLDAYGSGDPVTAQFVSTKYGMETIIAEWQERYGEPMPGIDGLYRQAYGVFTRVANRQDPLVTHLFDLPYLPQLAA